MEEKLTREQAEKANRESYEKELEQNPPKHIEKLDLRPGEVVFGNLSEGERFQVLTRYLNDLCSINKSTLQIIADQYVLIEFLCAKLGINVAEQKKELVKKIKAQQEEQLRQAKEELEKAAVKN